MFLFHWIFSLHFTTISYNSKPLFPLSPTHAENFHPTIATNLTQHALPASSPHPSWMVNSSLGRLRRLLRVDLLSIFVKPDSWRWGAVSTTFSRTNTNIDRYGFRYGKGEGRPNRTILPWMAQETQYCSFRYILGTAYSGNTDASEMSPVAFMLDGFWG